MLATVRVSAAEDQANGEAAMVQRLYDRDPAVREAARRMLLGLDVDDLPALAEALRQVPATVLRAPGVKQALQEAVIHAHIRQAKETLVRQERDGAKALGGNPFREVAEAFMGFQLRPNRLVGGGFSEVVDGTEGVPVAVVIAGFVAYERLEEGDVLIAVRDRRAAEQVQPVLNFLQLQGVLRQYRPGQEIELLVLRGGEVVSVSLVLDRRTDRINSVDWVQMEQQARHRADEMWTQQFAPAFVSSAETTASAE